MSGASEERSRTAFRPAPLTEPRSRVPLLVEPVTSETLRAEDDFTLVAVERQVLQEARRLLLVLSAVQSEQRRRRGLRGPA